MTNEYANILSALKESGNFRTIPSGNEGPEIIDLSSNDYLGLASKPHLQEEFLSEAHNRLLPFTSSASRLLAASQDEYTRLETLLGELYGRKALLFNSGYHANTGLISSLAQPAGTLIVADKLVHASIIDGIVLSKAPFIRYRHNDLNHLERILQKEAGNYTRILVAAESVYSMDGDRADIEGLIGIKHKYPNVILYIDEAHAFGVEGQNGLGLCRDAAGYDEIDVVVGTFGKACASMGAFCALSPTLKDYAVNRARSFIFSTALPPISVAWTKRMIETFMEMDTERAHLNALGKRLCAILQPLSPSHPVTASHIQPLVLGSSEKALQISARLLDEGFKVLPIRTPTVPPGTERLRISLSASLTFDDIDRFGQALIHSLSES